MSSQDEPTGGNPTTSGDQFCGKARDGLMGHLGRPAELKTSGLATPGVSSVVHVPGKAKAESDECPKIQALSARLKQKYQDTVFSGKTVFPPPVLGPYCEDKIRLKPDPRAYRHHESPSGARGKRPWRRFSGSSSSQADWSPVTLSGPPPALSYPRWSPGNNSWWWISAALMLKRSMTALRCPSLRTCCRSNCGEGSSR